MVANAGGRTNPGPDSALAGIVATDGSAAHPMPCRLTRVDSPLRDLADTLCHLCALHGRHPGVVDQAMNGNADPRADAWLRTAAAGFSDERAYLVRLAAAAGPAPSTPGQAATEAATAAQRHAVETLAQSARAGCALGAAIAVVLDWPAIRRPLDSAAMRLGVERLPLLLPPPAETARLIETLADDRATARAMAFGSQQLLAQHRGLWDLLAARADARG